MNSKGPSNDPMVTTIQRAKIGLTTGVLLIVLISLGAAELSNDVLARWLGSSAITFTGVALGSGLSLLWLLSSVVFSQLEAELAGQAREVNESNADLRKRVHSRTAELEKTSAELQASLRAKSEFLATMSHEIRTPMNGVLGMSQLLVETDLTERQRRYVSIINASGKSLLEVLNNVLDFSKIEAGKMELENVPFDLQSLVDECLGVFSLKAQERKVNLFGGLAPETPRVLRGDPTRLRQVLINLISNAVKFTFDGNVSLRVTNCQPKEPQTDGTVNLRFEVRDEGIGIDEVQQQKLFKAFSQSDSSTTRKFGGTGLGLVISRQLLALMGGSIQVDSAPGEGSVFSIELELGSVAEQDCSVYREPEQSLEGISVLVVESPDAANLYVEQLKHWGASAYSASSRDQALERVKTLDNGKTLQVLSAASLKDGTGLELLEDLGRYFPDREFQLMIIAPISTDSSALVPTGVFKVLERPLSSNLLHQSVVQASRSQPQNTPPAAVVPSRQDFGDVKALVAEDNQINQMVIAGILKKFNISPTIVEDGAGAINKIEQENHYDLILMDCEMPVMDGWEATELIRAREAAMKSTLPTKIVALSAHVIAEPKRKASISGMDRFVSKPVDIESVGKILNDYFPRLTESTSQEPVNLS